MKSKIKRHSRSVLSVILAISMLVSCMMVGLIATDAAKVGSESVGYNELTVYFTPKSGWTTSTATMHVNYKGDGDEWEYLAVTDTGMTINENPVWQSKVTTKYGGLGAIQFMASEGSSDNWMAFGGKDWKVESVFSGKYWTTQDNTGSWVDPEWDATEDTQTVTAVASPSSGAGTVSPESASAGESAVKAEFTATPLEGFDVNWTLGSNLTFADNTTASDTTIKVNVSDDTVSDATANKATANFVHKDVELHLGTTEGAWNISTTYDFTATGTNMFAYDTGSTELTANVDYYLYVTTKGATKASGTYYKGAAATHPTLSTTTDVTVERIGHNNNYGNRNGSVKFTPTETGAYTFTFDPVNLTISVRSSIDLTNEGYYSLTGNVTDKYIVGSTLVKPTGIDEDYWWSHYWDETAINNKVSDGVFSITFTTTSYEDENGYCANIGFAGKNNVQYAFIKNGTAYNTYGNDLKISDSITASDNLYVYTKDSGGSLVLKPNTTYTITVDQTKQQATGQPYGLITIDAATVYANAINMVRPFDVTNRRPSDLEQSNAGGTVSVTSGSSTDSTSGDKTTATVTHEKPMTATYTASAASAGYTFEGWYSDEDCTTKVSDTLNYTPEAFNVTKTLYALYSENVPAQSYDVAVTKAGTGSGSISVTGAAVKAESENTVTYTAYAGATVTVTATPDTTPLSVLTSITGDGTVSGNTATIKNIAANKALTVTFNKKTTYTVTLKGTNGQIKAQAYQSDKTTISGSEVTVASGSTGTIEVPIGGYLKLTAGTADTDKEFMNFKLEANKYKRTSDQSTGTSPMTIRPTDDMTAEAKFDTAGASSNWDVNFTSHSSPTESNPKLKKYTGLKVKDFNNDSSKDVYYAKFTLKSGANQFHMWDGTRDYKFTSNPQVVTFDSNYYPQAPNNGYTDAKNPGQITVDADTEVYVYAMYNTQDKELKIRFTKTKAHGDSSTISTDGYQRIYAMDGTVGQTAQYGDTVITIGNGLLETDIEDASGNSQLYSVEKDTHNIYYFDPNQDISFRVQTTVDTTNQAKLGVRGFVYNGKSVTAVDDGNGVYYADITVKANTVLDINNGISNNPILEVIPVYYNTTVPESELIKFYVDANTMNNEYGNNVFGYNLGYFAWYSKTGNDVASGYPGQPLLKEGTKYYGLIPKHYVGNSATYNDTTTSFSGMLLDNLHENSSVHDEVLQSWGCAKVNYQTFDYEDPGEIAQLENVDTIEYVVKYEKTNDNLQTGTHWYNSTYNKAGDLNGKISGYAFPSDISAPDSANQLNGFELLRDFDNNPVDVYGNKIKENFSNSVFIISVGNQNVAPSNDWDTVWMIYDGSTKSFILGSNPASFIGVETSKENENLSGKTVYINYEKFLDGSEHHQNYSHKGDTGNTGDRIDGRWLYTKSTDATNGRIRVATLGKNNDTLSFLTYDEGASGARIAYYDNSVDGITQNKTSTKEDNYGRKTTFANRTTKAKAVLNEPVGYRIVGFYMQKTGVVGTDNGFTSSISNYDEMTRTSATVAPYTNTRDTWIVAVVEPVPASNLYIKHEMYGGPDAHNGAGTFYVKAEVLSSSGTVVATSGGFVDGDEGYEFDYLNSIATKGAGYRVKVTLRTVMAGTNTLYAWYPSDLATGDYLAPKTTNSANVDVFGKNGTQETIYWVDVDDLYADEEYNFKYTNLAYYSDIDMAGAVTIKHDLKDGSVGGGDTYVSVRVLNNGTEVATFNTDYSKTGTITVPSAYTKRTSGNEIEVTLRTVPDAYSTFNSFWKSDGTTAISGAAIDSSTGVATKTLATIDVADLYKNTGTEQKPTYEFDTTKSTYQYYSDLTKSEYRYVIEYQYKSRIWGTQSYKVPAASDDEAFTVEEFNKYIDEAQVTDANTGSTVSGISFKTDALKKEFLASKAPYEDNFRETITWNFTGATVSYYDSAKQLSIKVTTSSADDDALYLLVHFPFECTVKTTGLEITKDEDGKVQYVEGASDYTARPLYMHRYTVNNKYNLTDEIYLQAPESVWKNDEEKFFSYWSLKDQKTGREYAKCYSRNLNYAFYQDTVVDLAYDNTSALSPSENADKGASARIEFLENTRNQWNSNAGTSSWNPADRVISDFVLYYNYQGKQINTIQNMKAGLVFETVGNLGMDEHDDYITNRFTYASKHASDDVTTLKDNVISFIGQNKSSDETYLKSEFDTYRDTNRPAETINKNNGLDNKNEIEYYYTMAANGTKERELKYYRVYSYLKDAKGDIVAVSDPIYLTIYDIASIQNGSAEMPGV